VLSYRRIVVACMLCVGALWTVNADRGLRAAELLASSQEVLAALYQDDSCRYLGFAVGNHESLVALRELDQFLRETAIHDLQFRNILIEGPADFQEALAAASRGEITSQQLAERVDPEALKSLLAAPQWAGICTTLLQTVQEINHSRPEHPILILPVDSFVQRRHNDDLQRVAAGDPWTFGSSHNRERETAENVLKLVRENPGFRGAIFYHQGHLLKNLKRSGVTLNAASRFERRETTHANWVGFAGAASPQFLKGLRVVLFNEQDATYNPAGAVDLGRLTGREVGPLEGLVLSELPQRTLPPEDVFLPTCYFRAIRPVEFPADAKDTFDAVINCPTEATH
jgi:hypothetical protein